MKKGKLSICFVCTEAICRSPMARSLAYAKLAEYGFKDVVVRARGLFVLPGIYVKDEAKKALKLIGVRFKPQTPQNFAVHDLFSDYIFCMTLEQKQILISKFGNQNKNVFSIAEFIDGIDVADPFGAGQDAYFKCAKYLDFAVTEILEKLFKMGVLTK